ncbi:beta-defensin 109-like [Cynocephalus volans]|uniref:beta-defensin 109-like n=1 Tax=Cynocephalus volans TaxID=110931 RepID=UPI002FC86F1E
MVVTRDWGTGADWGDTLSRIPGRRSKLTRPIVTSVCLRSGLGAAEGHCLNLSGTCRRDTCKMIEDEIGGCRRRWKCCRVWWILVPIPTPVIFSEYQEPLKPRIK